MSDDLISRESVKRLTTKRNSIWNEVTDAEGRGLDEILDSIPSIDAEQVIRCRDCKHYAGEGKRCDWDICVQVDRFYCYYGERKESCTQEQ